MWIDPINTEAFLEKVIPCLEGNNPDELAKTLRENWNPRQLCSLLTHKDPCIRRVATISLGLVGTKAQLRCLTEALRDDDQQVSNLAEHAMWTIWFRSGKPDAQRHFNRGMHSLDQQDYDSALNHFHQSNLLDPEYAEPYNQASIVRYIANDYYTAVQCARQAVSLMPMHFGAWATMGHAYAQIGDIAQAAACYRRAIAINPRLHAVSKALKGIKKAATRQNAKPQSTIKVSANAQVTGINLKLK